MNKDETASSRSKRQRRRKPPLALTLMRLAFSKLGSVFPSLLGAWAYRIWFSTRRFEPPSREKQWLQTARTQVIELAGIPVMTYQWGKPTDPLVVLVHGWNGRGSQMGAFAEPLRKAGFQVLAYDGPGHGKTPGNSTNIFLLSQVLSEIEEKISPIHAIIGHSFGGMTASLALSKGLNVQRVVLLSTPAYAMHLIDLFTHGLRMPVPVRNNLINRLQANFGASVFEDTSTITTCKPLGHIPALIIHDEKDHDVPVEHARQIHQAWPGSQLMITKGLGHKRTLYSEKILEAVSRFIVSRSL